MGHGGGVHAAAGAAAHVARAFCLRCCGCDDGCEPLPGTPAPVAGGGATRGGLPSRLVHSLWPWKVASPPSATHCGAGNGHGGVGVGRHEGWHALNTVVCGVVLDHLQNTDAAAPVNRRAVSRMRRLRSPAGAVVDITATAAGHGSGQAGRGVTVSLPLLKVELSAVLVLALVSPPSQLASLARVVGKSINKAKSCNAARIAVVQVRHALYGAPALCLRVAVACGRVVLCCSASSFSPRCH